MPLKLARYSVWKNLPGDDGIVALDETAEECARRMGIKRQTFYTLLCRSNKTGIWTVIKTEEKDYGESPGSL